FEHVRNLPVLDRTARLISPGRARRYARVGPCLRSQTRLFLDMILPETLACWPRTRRVNNAETKNADHETENRTRVRDLRRMLPRRHTGPRRRRRLRRHVGNGPRPVQGWPGPAGSPAHSL